VTKTELRERIPRAEGSSQLAAFRIGKKAKAIKPGMHTDLMALALNIKF
jgi:hypothetical protein